MERLLGNVTSLLDADLSVPRLGSQLVACDALRASFTKKLVTARAEDADRVAIEKFLAYNKRCSEYSLRLAGSWDEELVGIVKDILYKFFYPGGFPLITQRELSLGLRSGPGAAVDAIGGSFYEKVFSSPISYTRSWLVADFKRYTRETPTLHTAFSGNRHGFTRVPGSYITTVPKENSIDRVICVEPSLNMLYQLSLESILRVRLKTYFGIDLAIQAERNRELARQGSIYGTFATIDLRSASDCISVKLLEALLPRSVLDWLTLLRSPVTSVGEDQHTLHMISTMGNGFTFPLQTILFAAIARAVAIQHDKPIRNPKGDPDLVVGVTTERRLNQNCLGNWGVFGDDIIVETGISRQVLNALELFGFEPNPKKTFVEGPFRESCGSDWFEGEPVRGVYIRSLETPQDRLIVLNRLNAWTAQTNIGLPNTVRYLRELVPPWYVPLHEADYSGIKVPTAMLGSGNRGYKCYEADTDYVRVGKRPFMKRGWTWNSYGCFVSFLRGEVRLGRIPLRTKGSHGIDTPSAYRVTRKVSHAWDTLPGRGPDELMQLPLWKREVVLPVWNTETLRLSDAVIANLG